MNGNKLDRALTVLLVVAVVAVFLVGVVDPAYADFLDQAERKVESVWRSIKNTIYIVAGIGLALLGVFAFFGRFKWSHFFALAGGVFLIATADQLIRWLGGSGAGL